MKDMANRQRTNFNITICGPFRPHQSIKHWAFWNDQKEEPNISNNSESSQKHTLKEPTFERCFSASSEIGYLSTKSTQDRWSRYFFLLTKANQRNLFFLFLKIIFPFPFSLFLFKKPFFFFSKRLLFSSFFQTFLLNICTTPFSFSFSSGKSSPSALEPQLI